MKNFETKQTYDTADSSSGEMHFGDLFEGFVARSQKQRCIPRFNAFFREASASVGIADFVGLVAPKWRFTQQRIENRLLDLPRGPVSEILSTLGQNGRVHREELLTKTHYTRPVVSNALHGLVKNKVIANGDDKGYLIRNDFKVPQAEIYFYELKLSRWRRALFQAMQAQAYADKTYCVMPIEKRQVLIANKDRFKTAGVGVILFDAGMSKAIEVIPGRKARPKRPANKLDMIIRLATAQSLFP